MNSATPFSLAARSGAGGYFGAGFGGGGLPDEFSVFAGEPLEDAVAGSRGSRVTAPVVVAVPGVMAGEPETVEPVPVAVGRSEPPDAPDGGVETCAWATPAAMQAAKTVPIDSLSMAFSCGRKRARKHDSQRLRARRRSCSPPRDFDLEYENGGTFVRSRRSLSTRPPGPPRIPLVHRPAT